TDRRALCGDGRHARRRSPRGTRRLRPLAARTRRAHRMAHRLTDARALMGRRPRRGCAPAHRHRLLPTAARLVSAHRTRRGHRRRSRPVLPPAPAPLRRGRRRLLRLDAPACDLVSSPTDRLERMTAPFDRAPSRLHNTQLSFDSLGTPLSEVTFVIVDLETTGTRAGQSEITGIGALKTRGGEVIGEFQSLVKPERSVISPFVARLTGITHAMVDDAPSITSVLPSFLEFSIGAVLVAHNAPFDIGFLRSACERLDYHWPGPTVLDTVTLARRVVGRDEVRNHKLSTLAAHFGTDVAPDHRALSDARATGELLHHLFERF